MRKTPPICSGAFLIRAAFAPIVGAFLFASITPIFAPYGVFVLLVGTYTTQPQNAFTGCFCASGGVAVRMGLYTHELPYFTMGNTGKDNFCPI